MKLRFTYKSGNHEIRDVQTSELAELFFHGNVVKVERFNCLDLIPDTLIINSCVVDRDQFISMVKTFQFKIPAIKFVRASIGNDLSLIEAKEIVETISPEQYN